MVLTNTDCEQLVAWRRELHRHPEVSGNEAGTARRVRDMLAPTRPDAVLPDLGGHGVAAIYDSGASGPTVMIRAELDALPIEELTGLPYSSTVPGAGHLCGHDGHSAILAALARLLGRKRPARGRVVLMFQPAEEDGSGAAAVMADPRFAAIAPDFAFALHNMPGLPLGHASLAEGPAACASRGLRIDLTGRTAHAAQPETGVSPMPALARIMPALAALGSGAPLDPGFAMATVTHASMGAPAYGIAPGHAQIRATLRTLEDAAMDALCARAEPLVHEAAQQSGLGVDLTYEDVFLSCENAPAAVRELRAALEAEGVPTTGTGLPMRASEDFGRFGKDCPAALFLLGAGEDHPSLHNPDYDFPDDLIRIGARIFMRTIRNMLG